ncbi:MAG: OmpH family outer membrane protein [Emcibacteraceae bacterium]|nr:OmpH family outer membrane protein [Emcibacteraceae bacterium]
MNMKTNMKYFYAAILTAVSLITVSEVAIAQTIPAAKIAIVDQRIVGNNAAVAIDINRQVAQIRADMQTELQTEGNALRAEEESLKSQSAIMPQEAYNQKVQEFQQKAAGYQRDVQIKSQQLEIAIATANAEVERELKPIYQKILQEVGATMLMDKSLVLEQATGLDVTTRVIEELDLAMPSTTVVLPEVPASVQAPVTAN